MTNHQTDGKPYELETLMYGLERGKIWRLLQKITYRYQTQPVKIYYMFYEETMQEKAIQLIGSKLEASLAIEGKFSEEGLLAMTSGTDMTTEMAKALVDGIEVEGAEHIWKKINQANPKLCKVISESNQKPDLESVQQPVIEPKIDGVIEDENKIVYVDFVTFIGKKRKKKKVERKELTEKELDALIAEEKPTYVQMSLF